MGIRLDPFPIRTRCPACGELCSHRVLGYDGAAKRLRCQRCGHEWSWAGRANPRVAATSEAERRARRAPKPKQSREPMTCPVCGEGFVPLRDGQVTCSSRCAHVARGRRGAANLLLIAEEARRIDRRMREVV